jgi:hypothetical protein
MAAVGAPRRVRSGAATPRPAGRWRFVLAGLALVGSLGSLGPGLPERQLPWQRAVLEGLMPDFDLHRFGLVRRGVQLKLQATLVNRRHLVLQGRAHAPGIGFEVETPARANLPWAALLLASTGAAVAVATGLRQATAVLLLVGLPGGLLLVAALPVVLAGQVWALGITADDGPTLAAALVAASNVLLHGGGLALCAALAWIGLRVARAGRRGTPH